jgi:hypothetical protein
MLCNRLSRATAKLQNLCSYRERVDELVVPNLVVPPAVLAVPVPLRRVSLVVSYDATC